MQADDIIGVGAERAANVGIGDRNGDDDLLGLVEPHGSEGGQHRRPGREAVVDEDDGAAGHVGRRSLAPVCAFAPL
jgi:hypothetical protein